MCSKLICFVKVERNGKIGNSMVIWPFRDKGWISDHNEKGTKSRCGKEMFRSLYRMIDKHEVTEGSDSNSMNGDMKIIVDCYREKEYSPFPYTA